MFSDNGAERIVITAISTEHILGISQVCDAEDVLPEMLTSYDVEML